jgi:DNA-binding NarL/FixJ family response regulator
MGDSRAPTIRLAILGHCRLAREALATFFAGQPGFVVVGHTTTVDELAQLCALTSPRVAVIEREHVDLPTLRGLGTLRRRHPTVEVVVVYTTMAPEVLAEAADHGITAFVPGSAGLDAMSRVVRYQARERVAPQTRNGTGALTGRELAIAALITAGHSTGDIAALLRISTHTVDNHRRRIYTKFGVDNQGAAVAQGISLGIVAPRPSPHAPARPVTAPPLTVREREILGHIAMGHTIRQTARALGIAAKTVENTQTRLYRKLGTRSRGEALATAYQLGLIEPVTRQGATTDTRQR